MNKRQFWVILSLSAVSLANSIIWALGMIFTDGILDINALHSQSGWMIGEGWFESIIFFILGTLGMIELSKIRESN